MAMGENKTKMKERIKIQSEQTKSMTHHFFKVPSQNCLTLFHHNSFTREAVTTCYNAKINLLISSMWLVY